MGYVHGAEYSFYFKRPLSVVNIYDKNERMCPPKALVEERPVRRWPMANTISVPTFPFLTVTVDPILGQVQYGYIKAGCYVMELEDKPDTLCLIV